MAMPFNSPLMMDQELWSVGHVLETQHTSFSRYKLKIAFQWLEIEASHFIKKPSKVHFHWGSAKGQGSEHTIEGKQHDLEMHMVHTRPEQYHFFYPNTNTQYFQRGLNNTQYQYQFFEEALTIPNTNTNIHEGS